MKEGLPEGGSSFIVGGFSGVDTLGGLGGLCKQKLGCLMYPSGRPTICGTNRLES